MSLPSAASRGLPAHVAPSETSSSAASGLTSYTFIPCPPFSTFRAMWRPINPTPTNPMFMIVFLLGDLHLHLFEDLVQISSMQGRVSRKMIEVHVKLPPMSFA